MLRFLVLAAIVAIGCRLLLGRWPWDYLRGSSVRQQAVGRARRLLGITGTANRSEILGAHKRLVAMVHPDRGGSNDQVHEANAARDLLLDELPEEIPPK
ncbi:J domain-containing protein [Parerythrobacter jejuensis]|uniref:Molecular chaperone DnaJ n=1 Tax=Parerythrobacter jejuensis TaxID=795812 RepID=A0A845APL5_9SPHN|nr:molecular chaperone DnaJ [Parerythrobacter jejuensis]MXP30811.1 molecular chaperone DnaJ [Parerythrobacter jejuensis]MXP33571.1 molecular chaperone DnaJ [Parerythrobacter jejuensis]